ncbi:MAG TPA: ABC transporter permease [Tepidisphaeraceae bacterium]|jgi:ABC-type antimicrobial peptide transport system permease subunit
MLVLLLAAMARAQPGPIDRVQLDRDLAALAGQTRAVGSAGYDAAVDYVRGQITALPGIELQEHAYPLMTPQTRSATLALPGGRTVAVHPFFPAGVRLNATPKEGLTGELIYCGQGDYTQIPCQRVGGNIAVLEGDTGDEWKTVAYFNPKAILFLGNAQVSHTRMRGNDVAIPVNVPRFYLPDGPDADTLRKGPAGHATLKADVVWKRTIAKNLYAYVAAKDPPATGTGKPWAALAVVAPLDATGLVPDLSHAAGQAVQPAVALAMLRDFARHPPRRPVLVCFTGADSYNLLGTRQLLMAFADAPSKWREMIDRDLTPQISAVEADLTAARSVAGDPTKLAVAVHRGVIDRIAKIIETDASLEQDELFRLRVLPADQQDAAAKRQMSDLQDRQIKLNQLKYAFTATPAQLVEYGPLAPHYLTRVLERIGGTDGAPGLSQQLAARKAELSRRIDLYEWLATRVGRGKNPNARNNDDRLIELMLGLDLSDGGVRTGPIFWGKLFNTQSNQVQEYREWFERTADAAKKGNGVDWFKPLAALIDFEPFKLVRSQPSYLAAPAGLPAEMSMAWGVPGLTLATLEDLRPRRDTPLDTLAKLSVDAILPQANAVATLVRHAWEDPKFVGQPEFRRNTNDFQGQVVSTASGRPVPDLPREGFLATYYYLGANRKIPLIRWMPYTLGVRRIEVRDCDAEGRYYFDGQPRLGDLRQLLTKVYRVEDATGEITASADLGKQSGDLPTIVNLDQTLNPIKSVVFDCREVTLTGLYDPRFLQGLGEVQLIDARRNAEPQRFDVLTVGQMMAAQVEPGSRMYLLFRYGRIGNRVILLNMPQPGEADTGTKGQGHGFTVDQLATLGPLNLATARDFWRLNDDRIEQYRRAGVTSTLIDAMHRSAADQIRSAETAFGANDTPKLMRDANGAWADEARVYDAAQKMANDVVYAAIFLLLLAVPFSFCMERLLVGTPSIYKQIAGATCVFAIMAAALWLFHPAFKISSSPLIIILAFAILLMSVVVIGVVYQKFDTELKHLRSGRGAAHGTSLASASVLMSAIMLGIANMRRRRFRTALTAITVVLITFAVLCFTSASRYQGVVSLPTGIDSQYGGLLLRQRGFRNMPREALSGLQAAYPEHRFVERWWTLNAGDPKDQVNLVAGGFTVDGQAPRVVGLASLLGLSPGEGTLSHIGDVVPSFEKLENGATDVVYLSLPTAAQLKVKLGDTLSVAGRRLTVSGLYDPNAFDQRVSILSGEPIAPLKYSTGALDASGKKLSETNSDTLDLDADSSAAEAGASYEHLSSTQFAIVPAAVSRGLDNTSLRTIGVRLAPPDAKPADKDEAVKTVVDDITKRFALATFAGYSDGVKLVSASNLSSIGGGSNVVIPLAIGGLIIFNTMMGSIAERRREIHVYTSLGLAPFHVGALFVAEALTYGLIGSVFGYIIGQGVGTALLKLGWLGNVTLNYSGSSAMLTLGLILLIVLLSALVPARLASKIAAPSIERSWRVPNPVGDQIIADLPFTINQTAAEGVIGYVAEYFEAHQEGSIGKFSAGKIEAFAGTGPDGRPTRGLKTVIWLTPFDLGVRQNLLLLIHPGEFDTIYDVQVVLERLSGDDGSWWRMNRSFLTELRKQFLQWRSLSPQRMKEYVEQSHDLFAEIPTTGHTEETRFA